MSLSSPTPLPLLPHPPLSLTPPCFLLTRWLSHHFSCLLQVPHCRPLPRDRALRRLSPATLLALLPPRAGWDHRPPRRPSRCRPRSPVRWPRHRHRRPLRHRRALRSRCVSTSAVPLRALLRRPRHSHRRPLYHLLGLPNRCRSTSGVPVRRHLRLLQRRLPRRPLLRRLRRLRRRGHRRPVLSSRCTTRRSSTDTRVMFTPW
jgi:hypothetical protein